MNALEEMKKSNGDSPQDFLRDLSDAIRFEVTTGHNTMDLCHEDADALRATANLLEDLEAEVQELRVYRDTVRRMVEDVMGTIQDTANE